MNLVWEGRISVMLFQNDSYYLVYQFFMISKGLSCFLYLEAVMVF